MVPYGNSEQVSRIGDVILTLTGKDFFQVVCKLYKSFALTLPALCILESCLKMKINIHFFLLSPPHKEG